MKKSHKDIIKEDPEDLGEEWSSLRSVVAAPSATMVLVDEVTDENDTYTEIITPVTNNQDEEEGGSSLLALVGEQPDPGFLLKRGLGV